MADMLKITTPMINKNQIPINRQQPDPTIPFNLQDITKVNKPNGREELLEQNNGMIEPESSSLLLSQLKDPAAAVRFLKGIYLMQDIVHLLPVNNEAITKEIEQLFEALLLHPQDIAAELKLQENASTNFKGELFDLLRQLAGGGRGAELQPSVADLLKSLNSYSARHDVLDAVANNLRYLAESLAPSRSLSAKLSQLAEAFRGRSAEASFNELKGQVLPLLKEIEGSILFSPKMAKVVSITFYNLSRFNDNSEFLQNAFSNLMAQLPEGEREQLAVKLQKYLARLVAGEQRRTTDLSQNAPNRPTDPALTDNSALAKLPADAAALETAQTLKEQTALPARETGATEQSQSAREAAQPPVREGSSRIMDTLARLIGKQNEAAGANGLAADKVEKIIHSLLSSPCNYTPLLHFVIPVQSEDVKAFAEIWVNPHGEEDRPDAKDADRCVHMLLAFEVEGVGQFEVDLYADGDDLDLTLLCPTEYADYFGDFSRRLAGGIKGTPYRLGRLNVGPLERPRSLMEAFASLPNRRTGVNVKV